MLSFAPFATILLLASYVAGLPMNQPPPPPHPPSGKIVMTAPSNTHGALNLNAGANRNHPHIVVGHGPNQGEVHVAPVSHTNHPGFQPHMPTTGMDPHLTGNVHLGHVSAHHSQLHNPVGPLAHSVVAPHHVNAINAAKQQHHTDAHNHAANAHGHAAQAHAGARDAHINAGNHHSQHAAAFHPAHPQGHQHQAQAAHHYTTANHHNDQVAHHNAHQANHVAHAASAPSHHSLQHAHQSAQGAQHSHTAAVTLHGHALASQGIRH